VDDPLADDPFKELNMLKGTLALQGFSWDDYNFSLKEFIDPRTYAKLGASSIWMIDIRLIPICQTIRDHFRRSVKINDWAWGGTYNFSGYRPIDYEKGAHYSQHRRGCAADLKVSGIEPEEVRAFIRKHFVQTFRTLGLTTIEKETSTWTHLDTRHTGMAGLFEVAG
jgi:hypothetical protein